MTRHEPADERELIEVVQAALAVCTPLQVVGGGSKRDIGRPQRATVEVSTARFNRIVDYDPAELVLTVEAGARLAAIQTLLASQGQMLSFEPCDFAEIFGHAPGASTIGGIVGAGLAGSRRVSAGNVRDHLLGFTAVSGRGEAFVAGGKVVKNVTGYDVAKLMCGSWGQLAVMTQMTLKVLPRPRVTTTLCVRDLDDERAVATMTRALRSQASVAAAAYIPANAPSPTLPRHGGDRKEIPREGGQGGGLMRSHTLLRLEGFGPSVEVRARNLSQQLSLPFETLDEHEAESLWSDVQTAAVLGTAEADALWRIIIPSTNAVRLGSGIRDLQGRFCADWGGGLIWARLPEQVSAERVRSLAETMGGHATLIRATTNYRAQTTALHPESAGVSALAQRVKAAFDPAGILDPLRFAGPAT